MRPGKWVEPLAGDWGAGRVELIEIPTADETSDNIVAFWTPEAPILAGQSRYFRYRLSTTDAESTLHPRVQVRQTLTGRGGIPGQADWFDRTKRRFVIEFSGAELGQVDGLDLVAETRGGEILEQRLEHLPEQPAVRAVLVLRPDEQGLASDLRAYLMRDGEPVSEVWNYVWYPDEQNRQL